MSLGDNGHWRAEILPVARFGSNTAPGFKLPKPGDRADLTYDNDALDVLTELFDNDDNNISDDILNVTTNPGQQQRVSPQGHIQTSNHTLPDSPPYSGSEAYSPDNNSKILSPSACSDSSGQSSYRPGHSPDPPAEAFHPNMNQQHQLHNHLLQQQQHQLHLQQLHDRQILQQQLQLQQQAALQNGGQIIVPAAAMMQRRQHNGLPLLDNQIPVTPQYMPDGHPQFSNKKRKFTSDSPPLTDSQFHQQQLQLQQVKQEPAVPVPAHPPQQPCEFDQTQDNLSNQSMDITPGMLNGGSYQPIKWREFQKSAWCPVINAQGQMINAQTYRLDGDKGFNFSQIDKAFVCQKKNHFQITSCLSFNDAPHYVMSPEGPKPIEGLFMHFYGAKEEAPNQIIQVDQSQADRSKRKFDPVSLQPNAEHSWKVTIGRLHFSDTTLNNMRKRGKPNPDQRYFLLVVGIFAHSQGKEYPIVQQCSEKLIVRASNPGQFQDSEAEPVKWLPGQTPNSVHHQGKVGINTDTPDEALTVAGNVKVMGTIMQPSDRRVKEDISEVDTKEQLKNLQALSLYNYRYTEQFAQAAGLDDHRALETGVIAQELEVVIPEAVKTTSDVRLPNGEVIDSLKVVDKNRLFMESLGAVKELCNVTDSLENKITYLERFNQKLKKLKRIGSMRSTTSNESDLSRVTSISTVSHMTVHRKRRADRCSAALSPSKKGKSMDDDRSQGGVCSNKFLQILIFVLVFVMLACVGVIVAMLYFDDDIPSMVDATEKTNGVSDGQEKGDPYITTNGPGPGLKRFVGQWLMGEGCENNNGECDWNHCYDQCQSFIPPGFQQLPSEYNYSTTVSPGEPMEVMLETTLPQGTGNPVNYEPMMKNRKTAPVSYIGRRKRQTEGMRNPVKTMDITLSTPTPFKITEDFCLDCTSNIYNYTYAVQVSHSFPATNLNLTFVRGRNRRYGSVGMCSPPAETEVVEKTCNFDSARNTDPLLNVSVTPPENPIQRLNNGGATYEVEVGKSVKNYVVFRMTNYRGIESVEDLCSRSLNESLIEFRVWFVRVCYRQPRSKAGLEEFFGLIHNTIETTKPAEDQGPPGSFVSGPTKLDLGRK